LAGFWDYDRAPMSSKRQIKSTGKWEFTVKRSGLLPKPLYLTFETEEDGIKYCAHLEKLLDRGIVPSEYQIQTKASTVASLVREYERETHPSSKDKSALGTILVGFGSTPLVSINVAWVDQWIQQMKRVDKLAPSTIRAKVGALARCTDWGIRKGLLEIPDRALRTLPDGYAQYTKTDVAFAGKDKKDTERDRRLEPGEYDKILEVIDGGMLPRKQRPYKIPYQAAVRCLFVVATETAMRLREMYTLTTDQIDLSKRTVFLDLTKNGDKRQVPLSTVAVGAFKVYLKAREVPAGHLPSAVFPWWKGSLDEEYLKKVSAEVSKIFCNKRDPGVFEVAGCKGLVFHDLRHEATARLFERTQLSDMEIMKVTGHKSVRMLMRYANLRGSNLAAKLW
jgi:integrase